MEQCPKVRSQGESCPSSHASLSMRNDLSGSFLDFDLLPALLARAERTGARAETTADWAGWLGGDRLRAQARRSGRSACRNVDLGFHGCRRLALCRADGVHRPRRFAGVSQLNASRSNPVGFARYFLPHWRACLMRGKRRSPRVRTALKLQPADPGPEQGGRRQCGTNRPTRQSGQLTPPHPPHMVGVAYDQMTMDEWVIRPRSVGGTRF